MKEKKLEIDSVRVYQSVQFERKQYSFFSTREINTVRGVEIEFMSELMSLSIKSKVDHIIIPLTNISCIYLKSDLKKEQESKDRGERLKMSAVKSSYIKRQSGDL